ncbi:MAG: PPC domain-containing DNA-binding protein [Bacteroidia bacterium]|nr:PPC domain-containing DNA-binding protein [Bacteroidia bacterium]
MLHAFRLRPGQDLKQSLQALVRERGWKAAYLAACAGSLRRACLRFADQSEAWVCEDRFEIVSLSGTLCPDGLHLHIALAGRDGSVTGGHLLDGCLIYTTAEVVIGELPGYAFRRLHDPDTGYAELAVEEL